MRPAAFPENRDAFASDICQGRGKAARESRPGPVRPAGRERAARPARALPAGASTILGSDAILRLRKQALGNRNLIGARVEQARRELGMKQKELLAQLQVNGVDMNASALSKLEGQMRCVNDFELVALANILNVSVDWLLGRAD